MKKLYITLVLLALFGSVHGQWGIPDSTFGTAGIVNTDILSNDQLSSLAMQPDGKIVATGFCNGGFIEDFAIVRYNNDGSADSTFGINGRVIFGDSTYREV